MSRWHFRRFEEESAELLATPVQSQWTTVLWLKEWEVAKYCMRTCDELEGAGGREQRLGQTSLRRSVAVTIGLGNRVFPAPGGRRLGIRVVFDQLQVLALMSPDNSS